MIHNYPKKERGRLGLPPTVKRFFLSEAKLTCKLSFKAVKRLLIKLAVGVAKHSLSVYYNLFLQLTIPQFLYIGTLALKSSDKCDYVVFYGFPLLVFFCE